MSIAELHFLRPDFLWLLAVTPLVIALLWRAKQQGGGWAQVIEPQLLNYMMAPAVGSKQPNLLPWLGLAWCLATVAAAGPSWEKLPVPVHQREDALVLVLDLSYSMKAQDLSPSRLDRARQKLIDLLALRHEGQTALVAYAGDAHVVSPLTDDTPTIENLIPALSPDIMPLAGSNLRAALTQALNLLRSAGISRGRILLLTDGVDKINTDAAIKLLSGEAVTLSVLGIGTASGAPIPLPEGGFLKDQAGNIVIPTLERDNLLELASRLGGIYQDSRLDDSDLTLVAAPAMEVSDAAAVALDRVADTWDDKGYLLIVLLLPIALASFRRGWLLSFLPLLLFSYPTPSQAADWQDLWLTTDQQAQRVMQAGDNKAASHLFKNQKWAGVAAYRDDNYQQAVDKFSAQDDADSLYNRGNALAKTGDIDGALAAYRQSLTLLPDQQDALDNVALLEKLKEQQQQQQQQQGANQDQQNGEQQSSDEQGQQQDQQGEQQNQQSQQSQGNEQQEQQSEQSQQQQDAEQQPPQQADNSESEQDQQSQQEQEQESQQESQQQARSAQQAEQQDSEKQQAMEQWLRRVPDDPAGLLREKFRYESRLRQQQGERNNNEYIW